MCVRRAQPGERKEDGMVSGRWFRKRVGRRARTGGSRAEALVKHYPQQLQMSAMKRLASTSWCQGDLDKVRQIERAIESLLGAELTDNDRKKIQFNLTPIDEAQTIGRILLDKRAPRISLVEWFSEHPRMLLDISQLSKKTEETLTLPKFCQGLQWRTQVRV